MIKQDIHRLATPEGRKPTTPGHAVARDYLLGRFMQIGLIPYVGLDGYQHDYKVREGKRRYLMHNLIGVVPGTYRTLDPIVIAAHFDSVIEAPCADDNAAAVAVALEVATRLKAAPLLRDVVIAAFDGEEPPYFYTPSMGSTRFVEDVLESAHLAIVMDLIGHPLDLPGVDPHLTAITGVESHPNLPAVITGHDLPTFVIDNGRVGDMSDHHSFRLAGYPFLFLSSGEWADYHQPTDTPDLLDFGKIEAVADAVEAMARNADGVALGRAASHDILALEVGTLAAHVPDELLTLLARGADPRTSEGVGRIVGTVRSPALLTALGREVDTATEEMVRFYQ